MTDKPPEHDPLPDAQPRLGSQSMAVDEVARLYGVPPPILRRAIERGELVPVDDATGPERLDRSAVLAWLKARRAGWA